MAVLVPFGASRAHSTPPLSAGMVLVDRTAQSRSHHVRVNLRGGDIGMAQHGLHAPQVCSTLQQMGGEAVTNYVWRQFPRDPGPPSICSQKFPERLTAQTASARGNEQIRAGAPLQQRAAAFLQVLLNCFQRRAAYR